MTRWGDTHHCKQQDEMSDHNKRSVTEYHTVEMKWYGWAINLKKTDDLQITYCPWCGKKLERL